MIAFFTRWKYYIFAALIALSFIGGYTVSNWHHDSLDLVAEKAAKKTTDKFQVDQTQIADNVQKSLDDWRKSNVIVQEKITREKLQPVFNTVCSTDEYVRLFNEQTNKFSSDHSVKSPAKARD